MYPVVARKEFETNTYDPQTLQRNDNGMYEVDGLFGLDRVPRGNYQFAIRWSRPDEILFGHTGHINVGDTGAVLYAGTLYFTQDGVLDYWNNNTGHYKCSPGLAFQAARITGGPLGQPLLPLTKFRPYFR
jgi:hypothetical protein